MNIVEIIFIILGLLLIILPSKYILKVDNRVGYQLYMRELKKSNDEIKALRNAGLFYKLFGLLWVLYFIF